MKSLDEVCVPGIHYQCHPLDVLMWIPAQMTIPISTRQNDGLKKLKDLHEIVLNALGISEEKLDGSRTDHQLTKGTGELEDIASSETSIVDKSKPLSYHVKEFKPPSSNLKEFKASNRSKKSKQRAERNRL